MKTFWGIVPRYITKNKTRIFFMAIGIILTISLIVSLFIVKEGLIKAYTQKVIDDRGGSYDVSLSTRDYNLMDKLKSDEIVSKISIITPFGTSKIDGTKYSIDISGYEENITEFINYNILEGRFPQKHNEIALESWIFNVLPEEYKVGDKIRLTSYLEYMGTKNRETVTRDSEFTIVGVFENKFNLNPEQNVGKAYITREFAEENLEKKAVVLRGYIEVKPEYSADDGYKMFSATPEYSEGFFMSNYFKDYLLKSIKIVDGMCYVLFIIVGIVASIIIYNIFNLAVSERVRDFGMLRAIGASKGRIITIVILEGVILGIIFIPIGIIVGNLSTRFIMSSVSDIEGLFVLSKEAIIISFIIGFSFIILGSYGPARKAGAISPMEAITSNNNFNLGDKKMKINIQSNKGLFKKIRFTTNMAIINVGRNKKRFITSIISLSITIIMFMTSYYILNASDPVTSFKNGYDGDFTLTSSAVMGISDEELAGIMDIDGIKVDSKVMEFPIAMELSKKMMLDDGIKYFKEQSQYNNYIMDLLAHDKFEFLPTAHGYSNQELEELKDTVISGSLDIDEINNKSVVAIVQNMSYCEYTNIQVGDKIKTKKLKYDDKGNFKGQDIKIFTVGAILSEEAIKNPDGGSKNAIVLSYDSAKKYFDESGYKSVKLSLDKNADYEKCEAQINEGLKRIKDVKVTSYRNELENIKKINFQISATMYSFVFIVIIVSIINLINVMRMNVISRRKEIGMMRAIGFGEDEVKDMIRSEGILYGVTATIIGGALGTVLCYIIYINARTGLLNGIAWEFPMVSIIGVLIVTTITTTLASVMNCRQLFKHSIIDSINNN